MKASPPADYPRHPLSGTAGSGQFAALAAVGAFLDATAERIFEESGKGLLASL